MDKKQNNNLSEDHNFSRYKKWAKALKQESFPQPVFLIEIKTSVLGG